MLEEPDEDKGQDVGETTGLVENVEELVTDDETQHGEGPEEVAARGRRRWQ